MAKKIVIFIGAPGSGKDTQAFKLARKHTLFLFQSSAILKRALATMDPADPIRVQAEDLYKKGDIMPPEMAAQVFIHEIRRINTDDTSSGIAFSGCFRSIIETEALFPVVEELFGKDNVHIFYLNISKEESIRRNQGRRVCQANGHPLPNLPGFKEQTACRYDGSSFIQRDTDVDPEIIAHRYDVFMRDTIPVLDVFKAHGYEIITINGEQSIDKIEQDIAEHAHVHSF